MSTASAIQRAASIYNDGVEPAGAQRRDQPLPVLTDERALDFHSRTQGERDIDVEADEPIRAVDVAERRVGGIDPDAKRLQRLVIAEGGYARQQKKDKPKSCSWGR